MHSHATEHGYSAYSSCIFRAALPVMFSFELRVMLAGSTCRTAVMAYDRNLVCNGHPDAGRCNKDRQNRCMYWNKSCVGMDAFEVRSAARLQTLCCLSAVVQQQGDNVALRSRVMQSCAQQPSRSASCRGSRAVALRPAVQHTPESKPSTVSVLTAVLLLLNVTAASQAAGLALLAAHNLYANRSSRNSPASNSALNMHAQDSRDNCCVCLSTTRCARSL